MIPKVLFRTSVIALCALFAAALALTGCAGLQKKHPSATTRVTFDTVGQDVQAVSEHVAAVDHHINGSVNAKVYRQAVSLQAGERALQKQIDLLALRIRANAAARDQLFADLRGRLIAAEHHRRYHPSHKSGRDDPKHPLPTFDQRKVYLPAFMQLRVGHFSRARLALAQYMKQFPDSYYSTDALYWVAEIDYVEGKLELAHADFSKLLRDHPKDSKAPVAQLRLAQIAEQRHQYARARALFQRVNKRYPHSLEAGFARRWIKHVPKTEHARGQS